MAALCLARALITVLPFSRWSGSLGGTAEARNIPGSAEQARRLAAQVERAARRLPFAVKCLPQAMALSWLLRSNAIPHLLVFAVRPAELRQASDALHAWIEIDGTKVIGDLPGPWLETLRLGHSSQGTPRAVGR